MNRNAYAAHEILVAPARARSQLWRVFVGFVLIAVVVFLLNSALHAVMRSAAPGYWDAAALAGNKPGALLILLGSFVFLILGTMAAARLMHDRPPLGLVGPLPIALRQFWRVLRLLLVLGLVAMVLPPYGVGQTMQVNLPFGTWVALLPLSLTVILIQTSAEEILFRGYLQQALAARFRSPLVWAVTPAALFALGHYTPTEAGDNAVIVALWAGIFGVLMADLTARAGTLGPAIAVHLFNNLTALLLFAVPGNLTGLALYLLPFDLTDVQAVRPWLAVDFATMLVSWLAARVAIRR